MKPTRPSTAACAIFLLLGCERAADPVPARTKEPQGDRLEANSSVPGANTGTATAGPQPAPAQTPVSACLVHDGKPVPKIKIHAVGTEPFWAADVEGRCITYSTPDNQAGTRIWTRFEGTATNGTWIGALDGQPFVMTTKAQTECSDGMSDKRYPIAVSLAVSGEQRRGCAEPR